MSAGHNNDRGPGWIGSMKTIAIDLIPFALFLVLLLVAFVTGRGAALLHELASYALTFVFAANGARVAYATSGTRRPLDIGTGGKFIVAILFGALLGYGGGALADSVLCSSMPGAFRNLPAVTTLALLGACWAALERHLPGAMVKQIEALDFLAAGVFGAHGAGKAAAETCTILFAMPPGLAGAVCAVCVATGGGFVQALALRRIPSIFLTFYALTPLAAYGLRLLGEAFDLESSVAVLAAGFLASLFGYFTRNVRWGAGQ